MVARLKLKGIDGGSHKRWRMWLNSRLREEPYPGLDMLGNPAERWECFSDSPCTGAAWLSSARVVRCRVKSLNERNPCPSYRVMPGTLGRLPVLNRRKAGMTSSPHGLYDQGCTRPTMRCTKGRKLARASKSQKNIAQFGLQAATRLHEAGIASNRGPAYRGECVPEPCTHRPSSHESGEGPKSLSQPAREAGAEGQLCNWD